MKSPSNRSNPATVYEIAAQAGVSIATVSRVVNNSADVRPKTRARVLAAIEQLHYVPNGSAQGIARRSTGVIGLVYRRRLFVRPAEAGTRSPEAEVIERTEHSLIFYDELIRTVEEAALKRGKMLLLRSAYSSDETAAVLGMTGMCDGLILVDEVIPDKDMARIVHQVPVSIVARTVETPGVTSVRVDNRTAMAALIDHMADVHGKQRFAFVGGPSEHADTAARRAAVIDHTNARGLELLPVDEWQTDFTLESVHEIIVRQCTDRTALPDVILATNDVFALGVIAALDHVGLSVPGDIAVTGFDDMELARWSTPPLTTIRHPFEELVRVAMEPLFEETTSNESRDFLVKADPIFRASCGCGQP